MKSQYYLAVLYLFKSKAINWAESAKRNNIMGKAHQGYIYTLLQLNFIIKK